MAPLQWASAVESLERGESGSDAAFGLSQRPDGDVEVEDSVWTNAGFQVPPCAQCGGVLKPNVIDSTFSLLQVGCVMLHGGMK